MRKAKSEGVDILGKTWHHQVKSLFTIFSGKEYGEPIWEREPPPVVEPTFEKTTGETEIEETGEKYTIFVKGIEMAPVEPGKSLKEIHYPFDFRRPDNAGTQGAIYKPRSSGIIWLGESDAELLTRWRLRGDRRKFKQSLEADTDAELYNKIVRSDIPTIKTPMKFTLRQRSRVRDLKIGQAVWYLNKGVVKSDTIIDIEGREVWLSDGYPYDSIYLYKSKRGCEGAYGMAGGIKSGDRK